MSTLEFDRPIEPLVTAATAAEYLGFSSITVRRMARTGKIPAIAFPATGKTLWRFRLSDLNSYIRSLSREPLETSSPPTVI
jgi:excisionase family DNA binding protein